MRKFIVIAALLAFIFVIPVDIFSFLQHKSRKVKACETESIKEMTKILLPHLPKGSSLTASSRENNEQFIYKIGLKGKEREVLVAAYSTEGSKEAEVGVIILSQEDKKWVKKGDIKGGHEIERIQFVDITGDGTKEILFGTRYSGNENNLLRVLAYTSEGIKELSELTYNKLDIENIEGVNGHGGRPELILGQKITGDVTRMELMRWYEDESAGVRGFVPAVDMYPVYYSRIMKYYESKVRDNPRNALYWYLLAEAAIKAGRYEEANLYIDGGVAVKDKTDKTVEIADRIHY